MVRQYFHIGAQKTMARDTIGKGQSYLEFKVLTLGDGLTIQCADDVLLSCTLEPYMVLMSPEKLNKRGKNRVIGSLP